MRSPRMRSVAFVTSLVPGLAHAGGYISAGVGGDAALGGAIGTTFDSADGGSVRASVGQRVGPLAVEASYWSAGLTAADGDWETRTLGVDLKYFVGLVGPLELFGKGGLNQTWLDGPESGLSQHDGRGYALGAGLQLGVDLGLTGAAAWLDYTHHRADLGDASAPDLEGSFGMLSAGVSIGF